jgi:hypothetical protein
MRYATKYGYREWFMVLTVLFLLAGCGQGGGVGGGSSEFDNATATKIIMDNATKAPAAFLKSSGKVVEYAQKEGATTPQQYIVFCKGSKEQQDVLAKLEGKGLVKISADQQSGCSYVSFPDSSAPFIKKQEKGMLVMLAKVEKIEVTSLGEGKQMRTVKYKAYFTSTPFGEILLKQQNAVEEKEALFSLSFDEGWRMN